MPNFTESQLEKLNWSQQSWSEVMRNNMQILEDTLLKASNLLDVDITSLADNNILSWNETSGKFENVGWWDFFTSTTTTTTTHTTSTTTTHTTSTTTTHTTTTTIAPPPWLGTWAHRIEITLDAAQIDAALSNFPVPIYLSASSGQSNDDVSPIFDELTSDANRFKIAVTTSDGETECYVEIERWVDADEEAWLHVGLPSISATVDSTLYIYYDSSQADNTTKVGDVGSTPGQSVWDSDFEAVYHLGEDPSGGSGCIKDSTSNSNDGTPGGSMLTGDLVDGKFGKALEFDGLDDVVNCASGSNLDDIVLLTVEAVIDPAGWGEGSSGRIASKSNDNNDGWNFLINSTHGLGFMRDWSTQTGLWYSTYSLGSFQHMAVTYNNGSTANDPALYIDGASQSVSETWIPAGTIVTDAARDLLIGQRGDGLKEFDGVIDEVRISSTIRTAAWIKATYQGLFDNLLTFGSEENYTPTTTTTTTTTL